jgi:hypothetical protein
VTDKIVNLSQHKAKLASEIKLSNALQETESYESVIHKSLRDWHTYSTWQKAELYESVSAFNLEILNELIERMKDD